MSKWKPSPSDIDWTRNHIEQIKENGVWIVPHGNNSELRFSHADKTYNAVIYAVTPPEQETMLRIMRVLEKLGYLANSILWDNMGHIKEVQMSDFQNDNA